MMSNQETTRRAALLDRATFDLFCEQTPGACDSCGEPDSTIAWRDNGSAECDRCWRSSLEHGHLHGLHQNENGDAVWIKDCPLCPEGGVR
jgi:hypothetical protein